MQINRRVTNGLAWAGLFIVVGVPVADLISAQFMDEPESISVVSHAGPAVAPPVVAPTKTPPVAEAPVVEKIDVVPAAAPVAKPVVASADAVDDYLSSGKALPSYISGGDVPAPVAAAAQTVSPVTPVVTQPPRTAVTQPADPVERDPVEVASVPPQKIAPVPMPLSMRPRPVPQQLTGQPAADPIVIPQREVADYEAPVTEEDLADWEYGPLSDFLARQREQGGQSEADVNYDDNGFFLSDGPNQRPRRDRYVGPVEDELYFPFLN